MNPGPSALRAILERCGITLTAEQRDQLWTYHQLLRQANPELNLTRIHNFENMVLKHYVDSLLVLKHESLGSPLVDMGSGPGLPGIPLKIARPDLHIILAEPRHHRAAFLERVCATLKLDQIEVFAGKVGPRFRRQVTGVISRAVGSIPETLERVSEVIAPGGRMYFMKGPACDDEIAAARSARHDRFRMVADHRYMIPGTSHQRRLVVYERTSSGTAGPPPPILARVREVTSSSNPTFQVARDLLTGRGVRKHGQALLAGTKSVGEMLARFPDRVEGWLTGQQGPPPPDPSLRWFRLAEGLFRELDVSGTHAPLLLVRVPEMPEWSSDTALPEGCTIFVPFQDPENVGAVIRSAAAFQAAQVVLLREAAHPFHVRASRAAGTALFQVPLRRGPSLRDLDPQAVPLIALSTEGEDLSRCSWPDRFGLVPGLEGPGLPDRLRQGACRRIPIATSVDSLNGATAVAIALYEWRRASRIPATSVPLGPGEAARGE